jgi:hypothetical protein
MILQCEQIQCSETCCISRLYTNQALSSGQADPFEKAQKLLQVSPKIWVCAWLQRFYFLKLQGIAYSTQCLVWILYTHVPFKYDSHKLITKAH